MAILLHSFDQPTQGIELSHNLRRQNWKILDESLWKYTKLPIKASNLQILPLSRDNFLKTNT